MGFYVTLLQQVKLFAVSPTAPQTSSREKLSVFHAKWRDRVADGEDGYEK